MLFRSMSNNFAWLQEKKAGQPTIIFAGHNISEEYLFELTEFLKDKKFGVISSLFSKNLFLFGFLVKKEEICSNRESNVFSTSRLIAVM